ncbi:MAG: TIGR03773 family transporter-associated surface protein [Actinomycetaceae bacterium]|nr:TIGR03773 family transporter-associated surface protein [Actinomycetaceae bacterium]
MLSSRSGLPHKGRSLVALLLGVLLSTGALLMHPAVVAAGQSGANRSDDLVVLPAGHIDSPKVYWGDDGFELKANAGKFYDLDKTISWLRPHVYSGGQQFYAFHVDENSPALDFLGSGTTWWAAPSNCIACGQIWQGYGADTDIPYNLFRDGSGVSAADADGTFWLNLLSIDGPGRLEMLRGDKFEDEQWGTYRRIISSTEPGLRSAALKPGTHTHNWTLFSAPGDYTLVWQVSARKNDGTIVTSKPTQQHWRVGGSEPSGVRQLPLAQRYDQAPQGNTSGYSFSVSPVHDEQAAQYGMQLASWSFSAPRHVNGTAEIYINGHLMSTLDVKDGHGSLTQIPAVGDAQYQAVFFPTGTSARWVSAPLTYSPGASTVSTDKGGSLPVHDPAGASTVDFADVDLPADVHASVKLSPGKFNSTFSVDVRMSDPRVRGDVMLDFFESGHTAYPEVSYAGTLTQGKWVDQIEDLDYTAGLDVRMTFMPHSSMRNLHKVTSLVTTDFDPAATSEATISLNAAHHGGSSASGQNAGSGESSDAKPTPDTQPTPGTAPTPGAEPTTQARLTPEVQPTPGEQPTTDAEPSESESASPTDQNDHDADGADDADETPDHHSKHDAQEGSSTDPVDGKRVLLDAGHVDLAAQMVDGELDLRVKDDTGLVHKKSVLRLPHTVALGVRNHAREVNTPKRIRQGFSFLGDAGSSAYVLPETEKSGLIWPGYSTEALAEKVDYSSQRLHIGLLDGPGDVKLFQTNLGKPTLLFDSSQNDESSLSVPGPVHVHTGWAFTKPGRYEVLFYFSAKTPDGAEIEPVQRSVVFLVGDEAIAGAEDVARAGSTQPSDSHSSDPQPDATPDLKPDATPQPQPGEQSGEHSGDHPSSGSGTTGTSSVADSTPAPDKPGEKPQGGKPGKKLTLDTGHTDIFNVSMEQGKLVLALKEDVTGYHVAHAPEDVTLVVKPQALTKLPASYPAAPQAYVLPLNQDQNLLWPGWSTLETREAGVGAVNIQISDVHGPGAVHIFSQDFVGNPQPLLSGGSTRLPGTISVAEPAHVHAYWAFTKPGTYTMTVKAQAMLGTKNLVTSTHTYTWIVGAAQGSASDQTHHDSSQADGSSQKPGSDHNSGSQPGSKPSAKPDPKPSTKPAQRPNETRKPGGQGSSTKQAARPTGKSSPASAQKAQRQSGSQIAIGKGHVDAFFLNPTASSLNLVVREDVTGSGVLRTPEDVRFLVGDNAKMQVPAGFPNAGQQAWVLPIVQNPQLLWPGWSSERVKGSADFTIKVSGPGTVSVFTTGLGGKPVSVLRGGGLTLPGTIHVPQPAHVHANWIFSAPGVYTFQVRASADGRSSRTATYTFAVGNTAIAQAARTVRSSGGAVLGASGSATTHSSAFSGAAADGQTHSAKDARGSVPLEKEPIHSGICAAAGSPDGLPSSVATSGHFDLGPQLQDGKLLAMIRDDRQQPAQWCSSHDIAFGLGEQARTTVPQELSFLAEPGDPVWMISSVQQQGVPWLGESSQHESIIAGTSGEVRTTITHIQGPGNVAHFLPTALGTGVGTMLFSTVDGPRSYVIPANTHMHGVWAFTAPGEYVISYQHQVTDKPGKTLMADGKLTMVVGSCTPHSDAAQAQNATSHPTAEGDVTAQPDQHGSSFGLAWWIQSGLLAAVLLTNVILLIRWGMRRRQLAAAQ